MNTPEQQAILYRKTAETIEMCAKHGVEPIVKYSKREYIMERVGLSHKYSEYEFPITVLEGQLVWADTVVYNKRGVCTKAAFMVKNCGPYTLTPPRQPLCMVEGKPVYKGDVIWSKANNFKISANEFHIHPEGETISGIDGNRAWIDDCSWNPPKLPLCMVEGKPVYKGDKLYNSCGVEFIAGKITAYGTGAVVSDDEKIGGMPELCTWAEPRRTVMVELLVEDAAEMKKFEFSFNRVSHACRKALDNLKGDK